MTGPATWEFVVVRASPPGATIRVSRCFLLVTPLRFGVSFFSVLRRGLSLALATGGRRRSGHGVDAGYHGGYRRRGRRGDLGRRGRRGRVDNARRVVVVGATPLLVCVAVDTVTVGIFAAAVLRFDPVRGHDRGAGANGVCGGFVEEQFLALVFFFGIYSPG